MLRNKVIESAAYLREALPEQPRVALILGSGLGGLVDRIEGAVSIPYLSVPYMKGSTNPVHAGCFVAGRVNGVYLICMQGRLHPYEGYSAADIAYPVFVLHELGVETIISTNASGAINENFKTGDIVAVCDHINFTGMNPLAFPVPDDLYNPCPDMTYAYTPRLRALAHEAADACDIELEEGVYLGLRGPSFETPAEIRAFRTWGADLVGMSTVFEVIAASACDMEICVLSLVTNMAAGILDQKISGDDVNETGALKAASMCRLVENLVARV